MKSIFDKHFFFRKRLVVPHRTTTFSEAEISYTNVRVPFDRMKVSEKAQSQKSMIKY